MSVVKSSSQLNVSLIIDYNAATLIFRHFSLIFLQFRDPHPEFNDPLLGQLQSWYRLIPFQRTYFNEFVWQEWAWLLFFWIYARLLSKVFFFFLNSTFEIFSLHSRDKQAICFHFVFGFHKGLHVSSILVYENLVFYFEFGVCCCPWFSCYEQCASRLFCIRSYRVCLWK